MMTRQASLSLLLCCCLLLQACHKRAVVAPMATGTVPATVAVSPYDIVSPFLCRITATDLICVTTIDVTFRRGQTEASFPRGHQFGWHTPQGTGTGLVFFGCAGTNECGQGYFMFTSPSVTVTPYEPARFWAGGDTAKVPYGSHGILEVTAEAGGFTRLANRWAAAETGPQIKAGPGIMINCTDQSCTISLAK